MKADTDLDGETASEASCQAVGRGILSTYWQQWRKNILLLQVKDCSEQNETLRIKMYILAWQNSFRQFFATDLFLIHHLSNYLRHLWKDGERQETQEWSQRTPRIANICYTAAKLSLPILTLLPLTVTLAVLSKRWRISAGHNPRIRT